MREDCSRKLTVIQQAKLNARCKVIGTFTVPVFQRRILVTDGNWDS
jgi:hypothetical protein